MLIHSTYDQIYIYASVLKFVYVSTWHAEQGLGQATQQLSTSIYKEGIACRLNSTNTKAILVFWDCCETDQDFAFNTFTSIL